MEKSYKIYLVTNDGILVPETSEADLILDEIVDIARNSETVATNSSRLAYLKKKENKLSKSFLVIIKEIEDKDLK